MRLIGYCVCLGLIIGIINACKKTDPVAVPDAIGVVSTVVSFTANGKSTNINALTVDSMGNLYAADYTNSLIRKITPLGEVSIFAGTNERGYRDGITNSAQFNGLSSLAFDRTGNLYVGEQFENTCIRKISPNGRVSTFAGQPWGSRSITFDPSTSPDGPDTSARFIGVQALAFDAANNLFVSDAGSINRYLGNAIRKITPNGYVRTIAGYVSGLPAQGQLIGDTPFPYQFLGLAIDKANNIIAVDNGHELLYQITPTGDMSLFLQSKIMNHPHSLVYDGSDNLLVANGQKIMQISSTRAIKVLTGSDQAGFINDSLRLARFSYISAITVDQKNTLYIADQGNNCIRKVRLN